MISTSLLKNVAESVGLSDIPEKTLSSLSLDLEYRLREILQEATKFQRHCCRPELSTLDINKALILKNIQVKKEYHVAIVRLWS